jgi:hypothetical protein
VRQYVCLCPHIVRTNANNHFHGLRHNFPSPSYVSYHQGAYEFIKQKGYVPYDTCQPYLACSSESRDGFCSHVDTSCTAANTCRTCVHGTPRGKNGVCTEIDVFPNATIAEYGSYSIFETDRVHKIMAEIYARGPVAAGTLCVPPSLVCVYCLWNYLQYCDVLIWFWFGRALYICMLPERLGLCPRKKLDGPQIRKEGVLRCLVRSAHYGSPNLVLRKWWVLILCYSFLSLGMTFTRCQC